MGIAYRASGRSRPVMDGLAIHPYQDNSSQPPSFQHPRTTTISIADYNKLVSLLGLAFDGTAQPASQLPILYAEYGVESQVPPEKSATYTGREPTSTRPVDEATQARYYREALALAFCQPTVRGFFIFHTVDEKDLDRWQSGLYYADSSRKTSFDATRAAVADALGGVVARCPGLQLTPRVVLSSPKAPTTGAGEWSFVLRCTLDCNHVARLERLPGHNTIAERRGKARRGERVSVSFGERRLRPGSYRFTVRATAPVNVGPPGRAASRELRVG